MENNTTIEAGKIYIASKNIVAREIVDELIIVPVQAGIMDAEFDQVLFSLEHTGKDIWERLDGKSTVEELCAGLSRKYDAPLDVIMKDAMDLLQELFSKGLIIESK